jgi:apolipoprotein N-acyltransferase
MMHARWFVKIVSLFGCCMMGSLPDNTSVLPPVAYVPAVINQEYNHDSWWGVSPYEVARRLGGAMEQAVEQQPASKMVVGPESSYPFFLNTRTEVLNIWKPFLSDRKHLFGSILWHDDKAHQAVFCCQKGLIINFYVKKHLTPFGEKTPACLTWLKNSVSDALSSLEFAPGPVEGAVETFTLDDGTTIIPRICLEFFLITARSYKMYRQGNKPTVIFLFLNESWYNQYFKNILSSLVRLKTALIGLPVQYIGHYTCYKIRSDGTVGE